MTQEHLPGPAGQRTAEEHAAVRRRALPVALAGVVCGLLGVVLALGRQVDAFVPPSIIAVNLGFCALLMGAGMLFYAKGTPGTRAAVVCSVLALALGLAATMIFTGQSVRSRQSREAWELEGVRQIAEAARAHAAQHGGHYPPDLLVLLEEGRIAPARLQSPYEMPAALWRVPGLYEQTRQAALAQGQTRADWLALVEKESDYRYVAGDLAEVPAELAGDLVVASSNRAIMRSRIAVAFADGQARFLVAEELSEMMTANNAARRKLGLADLRPPPVIAEALEDMKNTAQRQ